MTTLTDKKERLFQRWYAGWAAKLGIDPNPDNPQHYYDYRAAWLDGATPDETGHWPSKFKLEGHPNLIVDGIDTRTGEPVPTPHPAAHRITRRLLEYTPMVRRHAIENGVPPDLALAVIEAETRGRPDSTSTVGAQGLMQIMPKTFEESARELGLKDADPYDPETSVKVGTYYLGKMLRMFNGDEELAVAAYNAGPGRVKRLGRVPNISETRGYTERIGGTLAAMRNIDGQRGFRFSWRDAEGAYASLADRRSLAAECPEPTVV